MTSKQIEQIFDKALSLSDGEYIRIPCASRSEQDSIRSQLYRLRKNYTARLGAYAVEIAISRTTLTDAAAKAVGGEKFFVVIKPAEHKMEATIVSASGEETSFAPTPEQDVKVSQEEMRMIDLLVGEGHTMEEALAIISEGDSA